MPLLRGLGLACAPVQVRTIEDSRQGDPAEPKRGKGGVTPECAVGRAVESRPRIVVYEKAESEKPLQVLGVDAWPTFLGR